MRIKLSFPDKPIYQTEIKVHIADINYGGHMGNDRFLTLMQEARLRWLQSLGLPNEKDIASPVGLIVVDSVIQYKAEVFHGENLTVEIGVGALSQKSFDLYYNVLKADGQVAAIGKTGIVCFDYENRKVVTIPDVLINPLS